MINNELSNYTYRQLQSALKTARHEGMDVNIPLNSCREELEQEWIRLFWTVEEDEVLEEEDVTEIVVEKDGVEIIIDATTAHVPTVELVEVINHNTKKMIIDGETVIIKTVEISKDAIKAHEILEEYNIAPQIKSVTKYSYVQECFEGYMTLFKGFRKFDLDYDQVVKKINNIREILKRNLILHDDIWAENLLINAEGDVKIIDFDDCIVAKDEEDYDGWEYSDHECFEDLLVDLARIDILG